MGVNLPTNLLRSFVAIVDSGSMLSAADKVFVTQSALSLQIKRLEDMLQQSLFTRDGRKLALTSAGELLLDYARRVLSLNDEAVAAGAMALFGEKYGDVVRVLKFGDFSTELCGGVHVARTGDIGLFKVVAESGVAAGIRRVEAVTGENSLAYLRELEGKLRDAAAVLRSGRDDIVDKIQQLQDRGKQLEKDLAALKGKLASSAGSDLASQAREIKGVKVLSARVDGVEGNDLRSLMDQLKNKLGSGVVLLGTAAGAKVSLIAGVTADLTARVKAGELVNMAATQVGGKGGGRPDMAQAGGSQPENLDAAIESAYAWVEARL